MEILIALFAGCFALFVIWLISSNRRAPPGPWGLPIVGYIPFLTRQPYIKLTELGKKYGSVFSVRLGSFNILILNDFQSTKEAFVQDAFIGRPPNTPFELNKETVETDAFFGLPWKDQRRHCLHTLRDLGLGKSKMEEHIKEEIDELLTQLEKNTDKPFYIKKLLASSMSNNIASLVFGKRLKYSDPVRQMLTDTVNEVALAAGQAAWHLFFPWVRTILKFLNIGEVDKVTKVSLGMKKYVMKEIEEHERTLNPDNIRDFIDGYLLEIKKRKDDPSFNKFVLQDLVAAFFGAGSETVRVSVEWLLLTAASDQKAQKRIQEEIKEVVGQSRLPFYSDLKCMPYTEAFMLEVMRWRTHIPLNLLRYTLADAELNGYFIPKHTQILSNLWAVHHDPEYWGPDADEYRPERFLSEDGKEVKKFERFIPFSVGKRSCPGEPLARVEIFLYFIAIMQKFHVGLPKGKKADFDGILGIGLQPKPQEIVLSKRE